MFHTQNKLYIFPSHFASSCYRHRSILKDDNIDILCIDDIIEIYSSKIDKNVIHPIEKISILTNLVSKYCVSKSIRDIKNIMKLAIDLSFIIDELAISDIDPSKLLDEFTMYFQDDWRTRINFLKIVIEYWPNILHDINKIDTVYFTRESINQFIDDVKDRDITYLCSKAEYRREIKDIAQHIEYIDSSEFDIKNIKDKTYIFEANSIFEEIEYVTSIILKNLNKNITIVIPDIDFLSILQKRLDHFNIKFSSCFKDMDKSLLRLFENIQNFMDDENERYSIEEILYKIGDTEIHSNKFIESLLKYTSSFPKILYKEFQSVVSIFLKTIRNTDPYDSNIKIININDMKYNISDIVILCGLNEKSWTYKEIGSYWLHNFIRSKIGLKDADYFNRLMEYNFRSVFKDNTTVYITRSKMINSSPVFKSHILSKIEVIAEKNGIEIVYDSFHQEFNNKKDNKQNIEAVIQKNNIRNINGKNISLLIKDPYEYYISGILKIYPKYYEVEESEIYQLFRRILYNYFDNNNDDDSILLGLKSLKERDIFIYEKCRNIIEWCEKYHHKKKYVQTEITGHIDFFVDNQKFVLSSKIDRIEMDNDEKIILSKHMINSSVEKKNTIYGMDPELAVACVVGKYGGFNTKFPSNNIKYLESWNFIGIKDRDVVVEQFEINDETIKYIEDDIKNIIREYFIKEDIIFHHNDHQNHYIKNNPFFLFEREKNSV